MILAASSMRPSVLTSDNFYFDPLAVRDYALRELQRNAYFPYGSDDWLATKFCDWHQCPFKSSYSLINALSRLTGEEIDLDHWRQGYPEHGSEADRVHGNKSCKWNCSFHFKPVTSQKLGEGVHNHVTDVWNGVGEDGWVGLIYLNPTAPMDTGLHLWENVDPSKNYDWMTPASNWKLVDSFGAVFNRLVLTRGSQPHSGANGFSNVLEEGRVYQTFFFKTKPAREIPSVDLGPLT